MTDRLAIVHQRIKAGDKHLAIAIDLGISQRMVGYLEGKAQQTITQRRLLALNQKRERKFLAFLLTQ